MPSCILAGLESFSADWPDANLTENDSFLSFVDCAVRQSLEPFRLGHGHNGLLVCVHHMNVLDAAALAPRTDLVCVYNLAYLSFAGGLDCLSANCTT